jgi:hypothetical protein
MTTASPHKNKDHGFTNTIRFSHKYLGSLTIDNGIDEAQWAYGLNTQTYPTYGGEVVQILSVYIDDLTMTGTCATYKQLEHIYKFFSRYLIIATQGKAQSPTPNESYNLEPMICSYPTRNWQFAIYPKSVPGFGYQTGMVGPQWQLQAHIIDDSPDLSVIKDGIKAAAIKDISSTLDGGSAKQIGTFSLTGNISPHSNNPNTNPFQSGDQSDSAAQAQASKWADYYSSLIPAYMKGDFSSLVGAVGSQPNFGKNNQNATHNSLQQKKTPTKPKKG